MTITHTRWPRPETPTREAILAALRAEGLRPYEWSNSAGDTYAAHSHAYDKVIYVVRGSIVFGLTGHGRQVEMGPGDRLDLAAGIEHSAVVGPDGVVCLEAHKPL